jgi:hypothetical protein
MWSIRNGGVPVFVHTIDVVMAALDELPQWQERHGPMDALSTVVGAMLHDLTKVNARETRGQLTHLSHSDIMLLHPMAAVGEALDALASVKDATGISLSDEERDLVGHIVASHHGPWGSVPPRSPEAALVHHCDLASARFHRTPPIDANDILQLLDTGISRSAAARILGVTAQIVSKRLNEACQAEWVDSPQELLGIWRRRGRVVGGSEEALANREMIRKRAAQAESAPQPILEHPAFVAWLDHRP